MTVTGVYTVTGGREYRGHKPGTVFEAFIPAGPEARAIARGDIRLERRTHPTLPPNWGLPELTLPPEWGLPDRWDTAQSEAPEGASFVSGGGK